MKHTKKTRIMSDMMICRKQLAEKKIDIDFTDNIPLRHSLIGEMEELIRELKKHEAGYMALMAKELGRLHYRKIKLMAIIEKQDYYDLDLEEEITEINFLIRESEKELDRLGFSGQWSVVRNQWSVVRNQ